MNYDLEERIEILEVTIYKLQNLLTEYDQDLLREEVRDIRNRYWEKRIGEDL